MSGTFRSLLTKFWQPSVIPVRTRYFAEKTRTIRRYGYDDEIFSGGHLPRTDSKKKLPIPTYRPKLAWVEKKALFGQNDYIDILGGDNKIHPTRILYNVPSWLRGFDGNELKMCIRRKKFVMNTHFPRTKPTKWKELNKRINYLYDFYNHKTKY